MSDQSKEKSLERTRKNAEPSNWKALFMVFVMGAGLISFGVMGFENPDLTLDRAMMRWLVIWLLIGMGLVGMVLFGLGRALLKAIVSRREP